MLEQRVGRLLPPSYREFLAICDGRPVAGAFTAGLRSAARTGWFPDLEAQAPSPPSRAAVTPLSSRKQHSDRTLEILTTPYRPLD